MINLILFGEFKVRLFKFLVKLILYVVGGIKFLLEVKRLLRLVGKDEGKVIGGVKIFFRFGDLMFIELNFFKKFFSFCG